MGTGGPYRGESLKSHEKCMISHSPYACFMPVPYNPLLRASREPILLIIPSDMNILTLATRTVL